MYTEQKTVNFVLNGIIRVCNHFFVQTLQMLIEFVWPFTKDCFWGIDWNCTKIISHKSCVHMNWWIALPVAGLFFLQVHCANMQIEETEHGSFGIGKVHGQGGQKDSYETRCWIMYRSPFPERWTEYRLRWCETIGSGMVFIGPEEGMDNMTCRLYSPFSSLIFP